jgi:hypothetical protein
LLWLWIAENKRTASKTESIAPSSGRLCILCQYPTHNSLYSNHKKKAEALHGDSSAA